MRYPASEKAEIIQLVEGNRICRPSAHWTSSASRAPLSIAGMIAIVRAGLRRWPIIAHGQIVSGTGSRTMSAARSSTWRWIFQNCRRESWPCASPTRGSYFVSEASVYRLLKAHDLITSPAYVVIKAANEFKDKTTAINQLWQTDFTYLKITGWGWYYLSTVLDDFSRYIVAWKLCATMCASDVTATLDLALAAASGLITSRSCTGHGFSRQWLILCGGRSGQVARGQGHGACARAHRIIPRLRERSSAGTRP
jgi:putative transposase